MQDYELDAWLGDDWTDLQREMIRADWRDYESSGLAGDEDLDAAVLVAISQHHDGTLDITEVADADRAAQVQAATARRALRAATIVRVRLGGVSEVQAARDAGVDRMPVRKWLGK